MARVPYAGENHSPEIKALAGKIRSERGGRMLNLYKMLLNSPPIRCSMRCVLILTRASWSS